MGKIINFAADKSWRKRQIRELKYQKLINRLEKHPAADYSVGKAEILADEVLESGGYSAIECAIPVLKIAEGFGFTSFSVKNMNEDISGNIYVGGTTRDVYGTDKAILVSDSEELYHQRFIVAHYLFDYVGNPKYSNSRFLFSRAYPKKKYESDAELRADRFAAELLMPAKLFLKHYVNALLDSYNSEQYIVTFLSELFEVKKSSVLRRIHEVGL